MKINKVKNFIEKPNNGFLGLLIMLLIFLAFMFYLALK